MSKNKVLNFVEHSYVQSLIIILILINAIILGLETSPAIMDKIGTTLKWMDIIILKIFIVEILLKLYAYRANFFTRWWSVFDLFVVAIALVPAAGAFSALRAFRVLRVLRLLTMVPSMRRVVEGFLKAIPGMISVIVILCIFFYVFAVIGTHLYSSTFPEWFGSMGSTSYTLFQIMTLESWSMGIVRPVMEVHPHSWAFFIVFILVTSFIMLNLFIAIIVNSMHKSADDSAEKSREETRIKMETMINVTMSKLNSIEKLIIDKKTTKE